MPDTRPGLDARLREALAKVAHEPFGCNSPHLEFEEAMRTITEVLASPATGDSGPDQQRLRIAGLREAIEEAANATAAAYTDHGLASDPFHAIVMPLRRADSYLTSIEREVGDSRPVGPVRIRSGNCQADDHGECLGMVEQDTPELGITDCLCDCHWPVGDSRQSEGLRTDAAEIEAACRMWLGTNHYGEQIAAEHRLRRALAAAAPERPRGESNA